jgi:hypothetical protein
MSIQQEYEAIYRANLALASYPNAQRMVSRRKRADDDEDDSRYYHKIIPAFCHQLNKIIGIFVLQGR